MVEVDLRQFEFANESTIFTSSVERVDWTQISSRRQYRNSTSKSCVN